RLELRERLAELLEAGEEHRPHDARLVAEQLVDRGRRGSGLGGEPPCGERADAVAREQPQRGREHLLAELRRALLDLRHDPHHTEPMFWNKVTRRMATARARVAV